jgi:hypothetical protein
MNDLSEVQRDLLLVGSLMLGIGLILGGPLLGKFMILRQQKANRTVRPEREMRAMRGIGETAEWLLTGDQRARMLRDAPTRRLALVRAPSATDRYAQILASPVVAMEAGLPARVLDAPTQDVPLQAPSIGQETSAPESQPEPSTDLAAILQEPTAGYGIIDTYVDDAQLGELVVEAEPVELTVAEIAFWRDPLASVVYPPEEVEEHAIPMAALAFDNLKSAGALTGIGADLDVEWESWNLYEQEEVSV